MDREILRKAVLREEEQDRAEREASRNEADRQRVLWAGLCPKCGGEVKKRAAWKNILTGRWVFYCVQCGAEHSVAWGTQKFRSDGTSPSELNLFVRQPPRRP